jgi:hypothetical protein
MQERMRDVPMKPLHWYAWYAYFPNFYNGRHTYGDIWQEVVYTKNRKKILSHGRIFSQYVYCTKFGMNQKQKSFVCPLCVIHITKAVLVHYLQYGQITKRASVRIGTLLQSCNVVLHKSEGEIIPIHATTFC